MASISIPIPKPLSPLDLLRRRSKPPPPPPSIASFSSTFSSPPFLRLRHPQPPIHGLLPRFRASVVAQDSSGQLDDEDLDDVGARGGNDWGQQEESSDEEAAGGDEGGFPLPPEDAKLFVGNLPFDVDSSRLANLFQEAGVVEVSEVIYNSETNWSRGFGFVTMSTVEEAVKATEMFNGHDLNGRRLRVNKATRKGSPPPRSHRIFVANIPFHVDGPQLEEVFSNYGTVIEARVVYEKDTGRSRGFAFVRMSNDQETDDAISSLDGKDLDGRDMRVSIAEERSRSSP